MKPFTRVPQPKEVASITWKRGEKQKRKFFTYSSCLLPRAKTSSQALPSRVLFRHPPQCPARSGPCRGSGTRRGSAGGAHTGPPAHATGAFSGAAAPPPRRAHPGRAAGSPHPTLGRQRYLGQAARLLRVAAAQNPLQLVHGPAPRPPGRPAGMPCSALPFPPLPRDYQPRQPPRPPACRR